MTTTDYGRASIGFLLPPDWFVMALRDEPRLDRQIHDLVEHQVGKRDEDATARMRLRRQLFSVTAQATAAGGVHMALSLMELNGIPIPASLTTYHLDEGITSLDSVIEGGAHPDRPVSMVDGPFGPMARCVGISTPAPAEAADQADGTNVAQVRADYWINLDGAITLMAFSSPLVDLADQMIELFDSVVSTVHRFPEATDEDES